MSCRSYAALAGLERIQFGPVVLDDGEGGQLGSVLVGAVLAGGSPRSAGGDQPPTVEILAEPRADAIPAQKVCFR